jgi:hypothetical protein
MQFDEVLEAFTAYFERERIRYAVIGGLAVHAWGGSRLTRDVDFVADRSERERIVTFAESLGYETLQSTEAFSNHVHADPKMGRVDLLYVSRETADKLFPAATKKTVVGDIEAPVASPEHIAMMKALAMKNFPHRALFEGEDVRLLLDVPGVDRQAVRDYFERLGLLDIYDAIEKSRTAR